MFPPATTLLAAPDAGFFLNITSPGRGGIPWYSETFIAADHVWNSTASGGLNQDCLRAFAANGSQWRCFLQEHAAVYVSTPLFIMNSALDMW